MLVILLDNKSVSSFLSYIFIEDIEYYAVTKIIFLSFNFDQEKI